MATVDVSIVTSGHDVADARLHREVAALHRAGLRVEVLGLGDAAAGPPEASVRTWPRRGGLGRAALAMTLPWRARGAVVLTLDPDAAVGAGLRRALGRLTPRGRRVRTVADVHEDYGLLLRDRAWARGPRRLAGEAWARLGERAAARADLTVVADESLLPGAPRRVVLRNLPDAAMLPGPAERDPAPRAVYIGDLRRSRGLFAMLDALAASPGWRLDLVGPVAAGDRADLARRLSAPPLAGRVSWFDRLPPREAWAHARGAWAGLLLLEDTPAFRRAVPSKLYEYLACGLAVLATPLPRVAAILADSGAGVTVPDPAAAAARLSAWAAAPAEVDVLRAAAVAAATALGDETGPFVTACRALVGAPRPDGGVPIRARLGRRVHGPDDHRSQDGGTDLNKARGLVKRAVVGVARFLSRQRRWFPGWLNDGIDWVRWRLPDSWVRVLTGRGGGGVGRKDWDYPEAHVRPPVPEAECRLFVGPTNFAGQGRAWARAVEREVPGVASICFALEIVGGFSFEDDFHVTPLVYRRNRRWQAEQFAYVQQFTHAIIEAGRPLFADLFHLDPFREAKVLTAAGVRVAMLSHGSDSRIPAHHAERYQWSPYRDKDWTEVARLQQQASRFVQRLRGFAGPVFVSTPDLLDDLPFGQWCPVVVDPAVWETDAPVLERERPVVVHAPSNPRVKGSQFVDEALEPLHERGLIEYRRIGRVPAGEMPALYADADIVLEQFRLGSYGVAACEAMAAGRVVVGNVTPVVRSRVQHRTGLELPVVQAEPTRIGAVVERLVAQREEGVAAAEAGRRFVREVHDGGFSARVLRPFLEAAPDE